jgi:DNA-binding NarL/FixJ family response regulator
MSIRVLIADDHEVVRSGLKSLLSQDGIEVVGEAADGSEAVRLAQDTKPQVVLLDVRMSGSDGLAALGELRQKSPETAVVILSTYDNPTYLARALALGAHGYLLKGSRSDELIDAIRRAASGEALWTREEIRRVSGVSATPLDDVEIALTKRESEVLRQIASGLTNKEIAQTLSISYETVKEHVQHVLRKIGVSDRTQAAVWAVRRGLV